MKGEADAGGLTAAAIALMEELAAELSGDQRFRTLMALAALRMAERERGLEARIMKGENSILFAGKLNSLNQLKSQLRADISALTPALHAALLADAVVRTAVTKPRALTAEEQMFVRSA